MALAATISTLLLIPEAAGSCKTTDPVSMAAGEGVIDMMQKKELHIKNI